MDHLPRACPDFEYDEVPYLQDPDCPYTWDNKEWTSFPERMGWSREQVNACVAGKPSQVEGHTKFRCRSLLQQWMYFGLLHSLTIVLVDATRYMRIKKDGRRLLTTEPLLEHLGRWKEKMESKGEHASEAIDLTDSVLQNMRPLIYAYIFTVQDFMPPEVQQSISVLYRTWVMTKLALYPSSVPHQELCDFIRDNREDVKARLVSSGWCQATAFRLAQRFSIISLLCMTSLQQSPSARDHSLCKGAGVFCTAWSGTYNTTHGLPECTCALVGPKQGEIEAIVLKGCLPALTFSEHGGLGIQSLDTAEGDSSDQYIAISHVCADGLGNPFDNTMHACQLRLLQKRVNELREQHLGDKSLAGRLQPFWIDTICVPAPEGPAKQKGMAMMETVYREATAVLVIDSDMRLVSSAAAPLQIAVTIIATMWWTRLWTLQEGVLAKRLYFQLSDVALSADDILQRSQEAHPVPADHPVIDFHSIAITEVLSEIRDLAFEKFRRNHREHVFSRLSFRWASRFADEPVCLAILAGHNVERVLRAGPHPHDRQEAFLLMQRNFPKALLFRHHAKRTRLNEPFRWAPDTFLGAFPNSLDMNTSMHELTRGAPGEGDFATVDTNGLHLTSFAFRLDLRDIIGAALEDPQRIHCYSFADKDAGEYWLFAQDLRWDVLPADRVAMLLLPRHFAEASLLVGLLVLADSLPAHPGAECVCRFEARVLVARLGYDADEMDARRLNTERPVAARAYGLSDHQKWCIR